MPETAVGKGLQTDRFEVVFDLGLDGRRDIHARAEDIIAALKFVDDLVKIARPEHRVERTTTKLDIGERTEQVHGALGLVHASPLGFRILRLNFGSPLEVLGKIPGLSASSRQTILGFFKHLMFYDQERSRREAEAALLWEKVTAARIENIRALAALGHKGSPTPLPASLVAVIEEDITKRTADLLRLEQRLQSHAFTALRVTAGEQTLESPDS